MCERILKGFQVIYIFMNKKVFKSLSIEGLEVINKVKKVRN